jgi:hypothetical protein
MPGRKRSKTEERNFARMLDELENQATVFGILKQGGKVHTRMIPNARTGCPSGNKDVHDKLRWRIHLCVLT